MRASVALPAIGAMAASVELRGLNCKRATAVKQTTTVMPAVPSAHAAAIQVRRQAQRQPTLSPTVHGKPQTLASRAGACAPYLHADPYHAVHCCVVPHHTACGLHVHGHQLGDSASTCQQDAEHHKAHQRLREGAVRHIKSDIDSVLKPSASGRRHVSHTPRGCGSKGCQTTAACMQSRSAACLHAWLPRTGTTCVARN